MPREKGQIKVHEIGTVGTIRKVCHIGSPMKVQTAVVISAAWTPFGFRLMLG